MFFLRRRRHPLLAPFTGTLPRSYFPDPYRVGQRLRLLRDVVVIEARLPLQQPRVHAGTSVRVLSPISDPTAGETYYRFEALTESGRGAGSWGVAPASALEPAPDINWLARLRGLLRR